MAGRETTTRHLHRLPQIVNTTALEDRVDLQQREIQSLLLDNQRLGATHVALKQELTAAQSNLRNLKAVAGQIKSERNAEVREVYDRSSKLDDELRVMDAMASELTQVRNDIEDLAVSRNELVNELRAIEGEIDKARSSESEQFEAIRGEIKAVRLEIEKGRAATENEKKTRIMNLEHRQAMENYMAALALEIKKLRRELANAEKRARAASAAAATANSGPGYPMSYGNAYPDPYSIRQGQGSADVTHHYGSAQMPLSPYDIQQTHIQR